MHWSFVFLLVATGGVSVDHKKDIAADCSVAIVGQPYNTCWDIANANGITTDQLSSFNPGLNCSLLQPGEHTQILAVP